MIEFFEDTVYDKEVVGIRCHQAPTMEGLSETIKITNRKIDDGIFLCHICGTHRNLRVLEVLMSKHELSGKHFCTTTSETKAFGCASCIHTNFSCYKGQTLFAEPVWRNGKCTRHTISHYEFVSDKLNIEYYGERFMKKERGYCAFCRKEDKVLASSTVTFASIEGPFSLWHYACSDHHEKIWQWMHIVLETPYQNKFRQLKKAQGG